MRIAHHSDRETALETAWSTPDAERITLVCLHSGVFTRAQYRDYFHVSPHAARAFVARLLDRKVAVETPIRIPTGRPLTACRISNPSIYRVLGAPDIRPRRPVAQDVLYRRIVSLDYVIQNMNFYWLPTEADKIDTFEQRLRIPRALFPRRVYAGAAGGIAQYFPNKMPVAILPDRRSIDFAYIDRGHDTGTALRSWGRGHAALWDALRAIDFRVVLTAVSPPAAAEKRTRRILEGWAAPLDADRPRRVRMDSFRIWRSHRISAQAGRDRAGAGTGRRGAPARR